MDPKIYEILGSVEETHWWFVARRQYLHSLLTALLPRNEDRVIAEIGAGTGGNFSMFSQFGLVDAVEMDEIACQIARKKAATNTRVKSVKIGWLPDNIPLQEQYELVVALDVVEHVEDDVAAIKGLSKLIKPNGYLLITVPAYQWLWSSHDEINHHYRRYTLSSLKRVVGTTTYEEIYSSYFNSLLFPLACVRRITQKFKNVDCGQTKSELELPSKFVNGVLKSIFLLERNWSGRLSAPFGLSIVILLTKR